MRPGLRKRSNTNNYTKFFEKEKSKKDKCKKIKCCDVSKKIEKEENICKMDKKDEVQHIEKKALVVPKVTSTEIKNKFSCAKCKGTLFDDINIFKIHLKTEHPTLPCLYCTEAFNTSLELKNHITEVHFLCIKCNIQFRKLYNIRTHFKLHEDNEIYFYNCPFCVKKFRYRKDLIRHFKSNYDTHDLNFNCFDSIIEVVKYNSYMETVNQCPYCFDIFNSVALLCKHIKSAHCVFNCTQCDSLVVVSNLLKNQCNFCSADFKVPISIENVLKHPKVDLTHGMGAECPHCFVFFASPKRFRRHSLICKSNPDNWPNDDKSCIVSIETIKNEPEASILLEEQGVKIKTEDNCCEEIKIKVEIDDEIKIKEEIDDEIISTVTVNVVKSEDTFFRCDKCNKYFYLKSSYNLHKKQHRLLEVYLPCLYCKFKFIREALSEHLSRSHYYCHACSYRFAYHKTLRKHYVEHYNDQIVKYYCVHYPCKFQTFSISDIKTHLSCEHKDLNVEECRVTLKNTKHWSNEKLLNQSEFKMQCSYCHDFFSLDAYRKHLFTNHNVYYCNNCKKYSLNNCSKCNLIICSSQK